MGAMNKTTLKTSFSKTAFAATLLSALALTYADTSSARDDHSRPDQSYHDDHRDDHHDDHNDHHDDHGRDDHHDDRHDDQHRYHVSEYHHPRGYQQRSWGAGEMLPRSYRSSTYTVSNYRSYQLHQPARGYRWVRVDNDVVLISISNGRISERVGGLFY
jgi:Ni/Co efflux regulator RcnB